MTRDFIMLYFAICKITYRSYGQGSGGMTNDDYKSNPEAFPSPDREGGDGQPIWFSYSLTYERGLEKWDGIQNGTTGQSSPGTGPGVTTTARGWYSVFA